MTPGAVGECYWGTRVQPTARARAGLRLPGLSWRTGFVLLGWFSAEIVTGTTDWNHALDLDKAPFGFFYYVAQLLIVADVIARYGFEPRRIFVLGLVLGLAEEAFYIKNPLLLALLLAVGHAMVTVLFPYLIVRLLTSSEHRPTINRFGYMVTFGYLLLLHMAMLFFQPITSPETLIALPVWIVLLVWCVRLIRTGPRTFSAGQGVTWPEVVLLWAAASVLVLASHQPYLGVAAFSTWVLIRQNRLTRAGLTLSALGYLVFHFVLVRVRPDYPPALADTNYPTALIVAAVLAIWLVLRLRASTARQ